MKVSDLVAACAGHPFVQPGTIGVIVEWESDYNDGEGCGFVKWATRHDFNIEYENDLIPLISTRTKEEKCST